MIVLNGEYGYAKVMLPKNEHWGLDGLSHYDYLDDATKMQIKSFLNHPAFAKRKIVIMPDTHYGKGSCVGFTMELGDYIIPNIIGVDIGCGIMATKLGKWDDRISLQELDKFIRNNVPSGFSIHSKPIDWFLDGISLYPFCQYLDLDYDKAAKSIGTLGGGNHFIELGVDEDDYMWLTIHSGSRNLGLKVANYYQTKAKESCEEYFQDFGDLNFLSSNNVEKNNYLNAMSFAQHYANINRRTMTRIIMKGFFGTVNFEDQIDSVHNYIDFEDNIIRKGATSAQKGKKLVIPFNMVDGLIIGEGLGNPDWNYSAPHGAGRILSRNKAKAELSLDTAKQQMESAGVFTTSLNNDTLDEAKGAYKDKGLIIDMIKDTVEVTNFVKPVYNFKAGEK